MNVSGDSITASKEASTGLDSVGAFSFEAGEPLENEKHELFCLEFLARGRNAVRAYQAVYPGTTYMSAAACASRLIKDAKIQARILQLHNEQVERLKATADRVLMETGKLAYVNMRDFQDAEGNMIPLKDLDPELSAAIISYEVEKIYSGQGKDRKIIGENVKIKLADKYKGLELLGKRLKVFTEKIEVKHTHSLEDLLEQAAQPQEATE